MTKGDNKKVLKLCFYQKSYHGRKRHHFNHINEPTNTFGQLVTIKSLVSIQWTMLCCWSFLVVHVVIIGNLRTTTKFTTTSINWERTGASTSVLKRETMNLRNGLGRRRQKCELFVMASFETMQDLCFVSEPYV